MRRRPLIQAGSVGVASVLSGCFGRGRLFSTPGGDVEVANRHDQTHRVTVTLTDPAGNDVFDEVVEVALGEKKTASDAFGGGRYTAEVTLNSGGRESFELRIGRCGAITFHVRVTETGELRLSQDHCD